MKKGPQAVILAAGKGVRFKSELPKVLHRVCGLTMLEHVLRAVEPLNPSKIVVVVGHGAELVRSEIDRISKTPRFANTKIETVHQAEQRGTGHATQIALAALGSDEEVLILPGDVPLIHKQTLESLLTAFRSESPELALLSFIPPSPAGYGRVLRTNTFGPSTGEVLGIREERDCSPTEREIREVNAAIYLVRLPFLRSALAELKSDNAQNELYLTEIIGKAADQKLKVKAVVVQDPAEVSGANSRVELALLQREMRTYINLLHMNNGVSFEDAERSYLDADVILGADSFIGAGSRLRGATRVGNGTVIDGDCLISNSEIGEHAHVKLGCVIESAKVGASTNVGPFAHLRAGTVLGDHVKIGNFVETKKAVFADGAKASHLTYVGDAKVGRDVNIGAGTITCNYDGQAKHETVLEDQVFVGSNTALVAPVRIGRGATIGAGSVITKDVPAEALAIERSKQVTVEGWSARKAKRDKG